MVCIESRQAYQGLKALATHETGDFATRERRLQFQ
jgi:hypothetical protein